MGKGESAPWIVAALVRHPEQNQRAIADELVDEAVMRAHATQDACSEGSEELRQALRVHALGHAGRVADIDEDDDGPLAPPLRRSASPAATRGAISAGRKRARLARPTESLTAEDKSRRERTMPKAVAAPARMSNSNRITLIGIEKSLVPLREIAGIGHDEAMVEGDGDPNQAEGLGGQWRTAAPSRRSARRRRREPAGWPRRWGRMAGHYRAAHAPRWRDMRYRAQVRHPAP